MIYGNSLFKESLICVFKKQSSRFFFLDFLWVFCLLWKHNIENCLSVNKCCQLGIALCELRLLWVA